MTDGKSILAFWEAIAPKIRQLIRAETKSAVRKKKMNVASVDTAAKTVTVYESANPAVTITVPYRGSSGIESLTAGQSVLVEWIYDDLSTAMAVTPGDGSMVDAIPTSRTINGKALTSNITLTASDVGARANTWVPTAAQVGAVPTTRTVNGKALSANITLSASDVGADAAYADGDTISLNGAQQYAALWYSTTNLRFLIPLTRSATGLSATLTGTFYIRWSGHTSTVTIGTGNTASCVVQPEGLRIQITFSSAQANASQYAVAVVQPGGLNISFS